MPYKDPEKRKEAFRKYYEKNKEKVLAKNRKWAADNPERHAEIERKGSEKRAEEFNTIKHDSLDEALNNLMPKQEPDVSGIIQDLKEIGF